MRQADELKERKGSRKGAQPETSSRVSGLKDWQGVGNVADWASADPQILIAAIVAVTRDGGAIRFGYSRDGGVYAVGIYDNGTNETLYVRPSEGIDEFLRSVYERFS